MIRLFVGAALGLSLGGLPQQQAPKGYHVGAAIVLPDYLMEEYADGRFSASSIPESSPSTQQGKCYGSPGTVVLK